MTMRSRVKAATDAILSPVGLQLTRAARGSEPKWFYATVPTCQIPTLSYLFERFFGKRTIGTFVEVGAYDGFTFSNTWGLAKRGWEGLLVEPIPKLALKCRENHRHHPKVSVVQSAVGDHSGTVSLVIADALTTANHAQASEYRTVEWARPLVTDASMEVPMITLDTLLEREKTPIGFDLLVVDVEGYEGAVFKGFDLSRWLPKMLIVELADTHPDLSLTANDDARLSTFIQETGYQIVYKDAINTVFAQKDLVMSAYT